MRLVFALFVVLMFVGCKETIEHHEPDAAVDAPVDAVGSGGGMAASLEPSPRDGNLEIVVITTSLVVALVPVGAARRRRRTAKDELQPHFS